MKFASALLFGLLVSSFTMASETLALIESAVDQSPVVEEATVEPMADSWELDPMDELMGHQEELSETDQEEVNALPIPEPAAAAILLAGLGSMGWMRYRLG